MDYNYGQAFFIGISLLQIGTLLSAWIVARFIWLPWKQKLDNLPPLEPLYEMECILSDNEDDKLTDYQLLKDKFIEEETPNGKVVFRYNEDFLGYEYWTDEKIRYEFLETVARKYVEKFKCTSLYIHREEVLKELKQTKIDTRDVSSNAAFAVFKKKRVRSIVAPNKANKFINRGKFKEAPTLVAKQPPTLIKNVQFSNWFSTKQ
jgi:hypothetical protein